MSRAERIAEVVRVSLRLCAPEERARVFRDLARSYCFVCGLDCETCACETKRDASTVDNRDLAGSD